jgi:hypothetical protein
LHVVVVEPNPLPMRIVGPFENALIAADWCDSHRQASGEFCRIFQVAKPTAYEEPAL